MSSEKLARRLGEVRLAAVTMCMSLIGGVAAGQNDVVLPADASAKAADKARFEPRLPEEEQSAA